MKVKIKVFDVGCHFAAAAIVVSVTSRRTLHTTRDYPYGMGHIAALAAANWADEHGHTVDRLIPHEAEES